MLLLPASMKRIRSRKAEKKWRHRFSHYKPMGIFFRRSREANSAVGGPIRAKFVLVRALVRVTIACKYEKDRTLKQPRKSGDTVFSIITIRELSVAMVPRVLIRYRSLSPNQMMLQIKFGCDRPTGCRDIHV